MTLLRKTALALMLSGLVATPALAGHHEGKEKAAGTIVDVASARKAERDAHMAQRMDATRALYAALDAEQQKVFDSQAPMAGMAGKHRGERGMRGHGHDHGSMRQGS